MCKVAVARCGRHVIVTLGGGYCNVVKVVVGSGEFWGVGEIVE